MTKQSIKWGESISSHYGINNGRYFNTGINVNTKEGSNLTSNVKGEVIAKGHLENLVNYIKIKDENGFTHTFAKLNLVERNIGDTLECGDIIGTLGEELKYQVENDESKIINPTNFLLEE